MPIPIGYRNQEGTVLPDPTEQKLLELVERLDHAGEGPSGIARRLNEAGFRTRKHTEFSPQAVNHYLRKLEEPTA